MAIPVVQTLASVVIGLFLLQLLRRLLSSSQSGVAQGVEGALDFLLGS